MTKLDHAAARRLFPGLHGPDVLLDNAGGSQVPTFVVDRMRDHLLHRYVQLGADYRTSRAADATIDAARDLLRSITGARGVGEVVIGPSTSALCGTLADAHARAPRSDRDEVVVCNAGHEANIGPWLRLAERGFTVRWWRCDRDGHLDPADLDAVLGPRTRIVAIPHVSNLLGRIEDVAAIAERVHRAGARIIVDGVAFAPHRAIDVRALGVDWYVFSTYKTYGPHLAVLFGRDDAFAELVGPNHYFLLDGEVSDRFEVGGVCHEGCAGLLGVGDYLAAVAGTTRADGEASVSRAVVERAYARFEEWEQGPMDRLLGFLRDRDDVRLIGPATSDSSRVPTVSFVHHRIRSRDLAVGGNEAGLGFRHGHFYAHRLALALGLEPDDGVVRVSLVHYNTIAEVDRCIDWLAERFR